MIQFGSDELILLRHAPADHGGRLCGRTDVDAIVPPAEMLSPLRDALVGLDDLAVVTSPARRCRQTAAALFPEASLPEDARLWEQDFGADEARPFSDLPDLGARDLADLAQYAAKGGESFEEMSTRVIPALGDMVERVRRKGPQLVIAHAGTARAALGWALGNVASGLRFEIAPLSVTRFRCHPGGISIIATNQQGVG